MNEDLYQLIRELTERVGRLEKMVQSNRVVNANTPSVTMTDWMTNCSVASEDVEMVYEINGYGNAVKNCILRNHAKSPIPLMRHKNKLYVYTVDSWEKWDNDTHMNSLIRDLWYKFIRVHMSEHNDPRSEDELYDIRRKRILEMKQKLYDVKKNRAELCQWLHKIDL